MNKTNECKIAIYSRKSRFTGKGESIENQIELCRQYIRSHYPQVDDADILIYEDEGYTGANTDRPRFKALIADAKNKRISEIVCYRLDRISRNIGDFAVLIEQLTGLGVGFVSIKEQFDTSSPLGRAMMYIASVFSQLERETIAERIRDNMLELAKTGRWLGGTVPTGYISMPIESVADGKTRKAFKLEIVPDEARLVAFIFDKFIETNSLTKVETYLMQNHMTTKKGNTFTRFAIRNILKNPVYMIADCDALNYYSEMGVEVFGEASHDRKYGIMAYNKTIQKKGKTNQMRDSDQWIICVGKHEGIISGSDWTKVQKLLEQNSTKAYRRQKSNSAILSGLLYCECGAHMRPKMSKRINENGEFVYHYLCETKERSHGQNCNIKNLGGNSLDKMVCEEIGNLGFCKQTLYKELKNATFKPNINEEEIQRLSMIVTQTEKQIESLVQAISKSHSQTHDYLTSQISQLHDKNMSVKEAIKSAQASTQSKHLSNQEFDETLQTLSCFSSVFAIIDTERKRRALRGLVQKITWDGRNVELYLAAKGADYARTENETINNKRPKAE